jgi:glycosyltransferase involved in cell wall biosynthesis
LLFYRVDFPDTYVLPFLEKYAAWAKGLAERLCWWYLRTMLNHLDGVIVHSEVMKEKLIKRSITSPIHVVGNLTNSQVFAEAQPNAEFNELLRDRFGEFKKLILFCGRLSFEKGVDLLLKAYEQLRDDVSQPILVIVGDGPMRDQISSLAADTSKRIYYIPATPDRTYLASIFASCDFMVMPGPYETFSIVTLEAIVAGLPVVGIRGTGGISALIKPGVGFLCENSNANELVENMRRAIIPKGSWYREEVRRQIIENYRPERVYSKLLQAYGIDDEGNQSHVAMGK